MDVEHGNKYKREENMRFMWKETVEKDIRREEGVND